MKKGKFFFENKYRALKKEKKFLEKEKIRLDKECRRVLVELLCLLKRQSLQVLG